MYGSLPLVNNGSITALDKNSNNMVGLGLTMEGINTNPVVYEFLTDMIWRTEMYNLDQWIVQYVSYRYGKTTPHSLIAWSLLLHTVYSAPSKRVIILANSYRTNWCYS